VWGRTAFVIPGRRNTPLTTPAIGRATLCPASQEVAFFPSASVWPAAMGLGFVLLGVGLVYGVWYWVIGGIIFVGAIIGFSVEAEARD
jgi:hypothetical protein